MSNRTLQGRYANIKTVLDPARVVGRIAEQWPDASVVWAVHDEPGKVRHAHFVVRFVGVVRWTSLADWLHLVDGHEYTAPAQSWRRSVRYLLHLDNPEKARIPREALVSRNIDESELSQLLGAQRLPILESLILAESMPLHRRFSFLVVERGHQPSEVSAALRCMMDLERWQDTRTARAWHAEESALPVLPPRPNAGASHAPDGEEDRFADLDADLDVDLDADLPAPDLLAPDASDPSPEDAP